MPRTGDASTKKAAEQKVSYADLYKKKQLAILCVARMVEPLAATSIQSYMYFQLRFFDPSASDAAISTQAGLLIGAKTAAQVCTGLLWGRVADWDLGGRRLVLIIGLTTSCLACIGYGFSRTFVSAIAWQAFAGAFNSNVSIVRCAVAETYPEKRYRVRALMLLPLCANAGMLVGPLVGGLLSSQPDMRDSDIAYPYALPNILIASLYLVAALGVVCFMDEPLSTYNREGNILNAFWSWLRSVLRIGNGRPEHRYKPLNTDPERSPTSPTFARSGQDALPHHEEDHQTQTQTPPAEKSVFARVCTPNVLSTMLAHFIITGHLGTFSTIWTIFLSTPVSSDPTSSSPSPTDFVKFGGGVGLEPRSVGITMSALGLIVVFLQLIIYPRLSDRFGTLRIWTFALWAFPIAYTLAPFPALVASFTGGGAESGVAYKWLAIFVVLLIFGVGRTGVTPATTLLINDCTPHPSVRATIHSIATVLGNLARSIFPIMALAIFGQGLRIGVVGLGFWCLTGLAVTSCVASWWVRDGSAAEDKPLAAAV